MAKTIPDSTRSRIEEGYAALLGSVSPLVPRRLDLYERAGSDTIVAMEQARADALVSPALDAKSVQLHQFAIYAALMLEGPTLTHCVTARDLGAGLDEILAVAQIVCVARGFPAFAAACAAIESAFGDVDDDSSLHSSKRQA